MTKITLALFVAVATVCIQGFPLDDNSLSTAAASGNWDEVHRILTQRIRDKYGLEPINNFSGIDVKSLKPIEGGHVYGESNFQFHEASNVDGHVNKQSGGHRVVNDDGRISEFDYKP